VVDAAGAVAVPVITGITPTRGKLHPARVKMASKKSFRNKKDIRFTCCSLRL